MKRGDKGKLFILFVPLFTLSPYSARLCAPCGETSASFRRVSYHTSTRISLTTRDVFVRYDKSQRTTLNLSASVSGC